MRAALLLVILATGCVAAPSPGIGDEGARDADATWGGASSLTLVDKEVAVSGLVHAGGPDRCLLQCAGALLTSGSLLVPFDTARIDVTAEWEGGPMRLKLRYDHGASADLVETEVARGEPLVIELTPGMADAPGQRHTHWWWSFRVSDEAAATPEMPARVVIVAHRAAQPVASPPARDVWASGEPVVLVPAHPRSNQIALTPAAARCVSCDGTGWSSAPGGIVAPDAARVRVSVSWTGDTPLAASAFVPPETAVELELVSEEANSRVYEVAVDPALADSPDQTKSLWWFFASPQREAGVVDGEFTLTAEALR